MSKQNSISVSSGKMRVAKHARIIHDLSGKRGHLETRISRVDCNLFVGIGEPTRYCDDREGS